MKAKFLVPLLLFFGLAGFLAFGLTLNPREVPSPLIDKPAPDFSLARLDQPEQTFSLKEMQGEVWLLNVWASWCVACREEHPVLVRMAQMGRQKLVDIHAHHLIPRVPKELGGSGVHAFNGAILANHQHGIGRSFKNAVRTFFSRQSLVGGF